MRDVLAVACVALLWPSPLFAQGTRASGEEEDWRRRARRGVRRWDTRVSRQPSHEARASVTFGAGQMRVAQRLSW